MTFPRSSLVLSLVGAAACASSGDPQTPSTDSDATVTMSFTTADSSSSTPDPSADDDDDGDDGSPTGDPDDSSTGVATGTGSGDSTDSTGGCRPGEAGCECLPDAEPPCGEGLLCTDGVCVAPMCPTDVDEPNNLQSETIHFADIDDGAGNQQLARVLAGTEDVDWWSYGCSDTLIEEVEPVSMMIANPMPRLCVFLDCDIGGNPIFTDGCPPGSIEDQAPTGFLPGCCVMDGSELDLTAFNCPDSSDETLTVYFRVDDAPQDVCIDYTIDFHC